MTPIEWKHLRLQSPLAGYDKLTMGDIARKGWFRCTHTFLSTASVLPGGLCGDGRFCTTRCGLRRRHSNVFHIPLQNLFLTSCLASVFDQFENKPRSQCCQVAGCGFAKLSRTAHKLPAWHSSRLSTRVRYPQIPRRLKMEKVCSSDCARCMDRVPRERPRRMRDSNPNQGFGDGEGA